MDKTDNVPFVPLKSIKGETKFYRGTFTLNEIGDAFLKRPGVKGCVWVNGFPLGRYWNLGPTETLYAPSAVFRKGINTVVIFEQEELLSETLEFSPVHLPGELETER